MFMSSSVNTTEGPRMHVVCDVWCMMSWSATDSFRNRNAAISPANASHDTLPSSCQCHACMHTCVCSRFFFFLFLLLLFCLPHSPWWLVPSRASGAQPAALSKVRRSGTQGRGLLLQVQRRRHELSGFFFFTKDLAPPTCCKRRFPSSSVIRS